MNLSGGGGTVLFYNARRARRVRWLIYASAAFCVGFLYWAADLAQTYGLSPGDGGVLRPQSERHLYAALVAVLGLLPLLGMICYARVYLSRIELRGARLLLFTVGAFGTRVEEVDLAAMRAPRFHDWEFDPGSSVSAPWLSVRVDGRRWPFILDVGAEHVDRPAIDMLLGEREM